MKMIVLSALSLFYITTFLITPVGTELRRNETTELYSWGPNTVAQYDPVFVLKASSYGDFILTREVVHLGCDCLNVFCNATCCVCRLDCPAGLPLGDKVIPKVYGNCSHSFIPKFGKATTQIYSSQIREILFQRANNNYWMCDDASQFKHTMAEMYRFLCVRSDNLVLLGVFFPDMPNRLPPFELRELIGRDSFWSHVTAQHIRNSMNMNLRLNRSDVSPSSGSRLSTTPLSDYRFSISG